MSDQVRNPRRQFLVWGAAATTTGVAAYLGLPNRGGNEISSRGTASEKAIATQKPAEVAPMPKGPIHRDLFLPHLNSEFTLKLNASARAACKLVEVSPATVMKTAKGTFVAFSLMFESHPGFLRDGGTCEVTHPDLQPMQLFLSPVGMAKKDKALLEAAFTLRA
ncbi:MAG: DUF6916 family protein [Prosthecobacter sp.]|jgi:hypothetical protein